ncbi:hypothetical protein [Vreelandella azerica]|uniref:hypothetical protein n=1 Tax=Vreelandella azerica TaxID=2732867 RepID=UPI002E2AD9A4|nr:hypothetical protein [Halomonas azerica]
MADLLDRSFLRSRLRDQGNWLANADFSREYMRFDASPPRYSQPAYASISNAYIDNRNASNSANPVREVREVAIRAATRPTSASHGGGGFS